ncbi:MAG: hypothetical protein ABH821_02285, partial [archaeon]
SELPENSNVVSNNYRLVWFYSGKQASHLPRVVDIDNASDVYSSLIENNFTHLIEYCNNRYLSDVVLESLLADEKITESFNNDCVSLYEVS